MQKITTHFTQNKLPYLDAAGVKYEVIESKPDSVMIDMEVDGFTLIELFEAGQRKGIDDMANNLTKNLQP